MNIVTTRSVIRSTATLIGYSISTRGTDRYSRPYHHHRGYEGLLKQCGEGFNIFEVDLYCLPFSAAVRKSKLDILAVLVNVH
jgi:hypothetical protein